MNHPKRALAGAVAFGAAFGAGQPVFADTITMACGSGSRAELCTRQANAWAEQAGHTVEPVSIPDSSTERLALFQQILAAQGTDIDVYAIDIVWPGILGTHFVDLKEHSGGAEANHFEAIVNNNTMDGALVAMPWFTDAGLLYYRKDLLEKHGESVPTTWAELKSSAEKIQQAERDAGNDGFWGFVWQGRAYEGLTCDALEWVTSYNGGNIVEPDGKISINNPNAVEAIEMAASWVGTISPPGVLNYAEEDARGVFQSGNALYMRNWPYAWSLGNNPESPVAGKIGAAPLPKGGEDGRHAGTLGGWNLAVSKYSESADAAAELVVYLTNEDQQKDNAINASLLPTIVSLYEDPDVIEAQPFFGELYNVFTNAVPRPSTVTGTRYNQVSNEFWNAVHVVLSGKKSAAASLEDLEGKLKRLSRGGRW